ncbi:MAG: cysteine desulfurase [Trueperaceae bacterium]|nr:MAG: cysteine desulfurase [Trueperaceae bacterium]
MDPNELRKDFPILDRTVHGNPLIYFDNAASSQKPRQVVEAMVDYYYNHHANVHRGAHTLSVEATELYEQARKKVARFLNAPTERSVVFTRNTTEAMNLVVHSWGREHLRSGDEIIVSVAEHHANLVPWHLQAESLGITIKTVGLTDQYRLDLDGLEQAITDRTRLISIWHMNNVLGAINPIRKIADLAHAAGALLLVDGAQAAPHVKVDVQALDVDFYTLSGHKMCGPTGAGALWARADVLAGMPPFLGGGEMIGKVYLDHSTYADIPFRFEAGTPNIAEVIGLGAAVDYLEAIGLEAIFEHDQQLTRYALEKLKPLDGIMLYGPEGDDRGGIIAFNIDGIHPHDVASVLDEAGIAVRAGQHCAQPLMRSLNVPATARASFYLYNTFEEIDRFVDVLVRTRDYFAAHV